MTNEPISDIAERSSGLAKPAGPQPIDARGPRFGASITAVLLLVAIYLAAVGTSPEAAKLSITERISDPAFLLLTVLALLFVWGFTAPKSAPWAVLFRVLVRPRLSATTDWEDPRPPRFAQGVGFSVVTVGLVLHVLAVPWALVIFGSFAFVAAFLNAVFGLCLGCQMYLALVRLRVIRPASSA